MTVLQFPDGFLWGVATSAYQIEGGWNEDGRSPSIWDTFAKTPGKTKNGATGDVACDHYHRWPEDVALMKELGIQAYRFSVSWPRILPDGKGRVNQKGLDFYGRLIDALLEANITPFVTLYHWELPQVLQDAGGWPHRDTASAFAELADVTSRALGDRVTNWITHNEPWCTTLLSHQVGVHAPGWQDWPAALTAAHHVLLSHGLATERIRANVPEAEVGIAVNFEPATPASSDPADYHAARIWDGYYFRWFMDALYGRHYPADMVDTYTKQSRLPNGLDFVQDGDMDIIAAPLDFLGVNYYTRHIAQAGESLDTHRSVPNPGAEYTAMNWEVHPDSFYKLLNRLYFEYNMPKLYITENGCSYLDEPDGNGRVRDQKRIDYLNGHITAVHRAIQNGVPVAGYLQWSLLDNYEWAEGYTQRFGIVYVDYKTQKRIPKESAFWYRNLITTNKLTI
ncbi:MAG: beta-glucosidase [Ardenticatenaceae bacterium]|nr:beta-glucosidase [Ardenticatenaceae bacterium]